MSEPVWKRDVVDDGGTCGWCPKPALRREIVPVKGWQRRYVGACRDHFDKLDALSLARASAAAAKHENGVDAGKHIDAKRRRVLTGKRGKL